MPGSETSDLWDDYENIRFLRELANFYLYKKGGNGGLPLSLVAADLERRMASSGSKQRRGSSSNIRREKERHAVYQRLRRYMFYETITVRDPRLLNALFEEVMEWLVANDEEGEVSRSHFISLARSRGWFDRLGMKTRRSEHRPTDEIDESAAAAADMFRVFFGTSHREFENAAMGLTGRTRCDDPEPGPNDSQGFITYRFSSRPGDIVKTFTLVTPPSEKHPYCSFQNFYHSDDGVTKESRGVALRLDRATYMLGRINRGEAIKLFILPSVTAAAKLICGLVATISDSGTPLVSRVVMERTLHKSPNASPEVRPTIVPHNEVGGRVDPRIVRRLRNYTEFEMGREIYSTTLKEHISTPIMVEMVSKLCDKQFTLQGASFNPASHEHYPFNQALLSFDVREK